MWFMFVIPFIIFFVVFLMIAFSFFRGHKQTGESMQHMINTVSAYAEQEVEKMFKELEPQNKTCEYCGATLDNNAIKCNSCGAKTKK